MLEDLFSRPDADARLLVGPRGVIVHINPQAEVLFGYPREELLDQPINRLIPERFAHYHDALRQAFTCEPVERPMDAGRRLYTMRKDGTELEVEIGLLPVMMGVDRFTMVVVRAIVEGEQQVS